MNGITEEQLEQILNAVRGGSDIDTACHFAGASNVALYRALERGKIESELQTQGMSNGEQEEPFLALWDALKKARADAIVRNVAHIQKAAQQGNWKAAAWYLEKAAPEIYGKQPADRKPIANQDIQEITGA